MPRTGRPKALLELTEQERDQLQRWARRRKSSQGLALRSRIVLACASGSDNKAVAAELGCAQATVLDQLTAPTSVPPCPSCPAGSSRLPPTPLTSTTGRPSTSGTTRHTPRARCCSTSSRPSTTSAARWHVDDPAVLLMVDDGSRWYSNGLQELAAEITKTAELLDRIEEAGSLGNG